ncbi:MAG: ADP-glyceromanno-heptose 6-epimerase [Epsilonproteobacteria bacterium]|nr:MAG: ADP-glyceromanno-heptose 6-epimerase [Campylobacterota bacterium]RLA67653.1 MAG: ADP-glyceromanno-heptose 6-epimerase [Campylobacterota bacterium]
MFLITGAAGFIGSVLIRSLNLRGMDNIIAVDMTDDLSNLEKADITSYLDASLVLKDDFPWEDIRYVFHMGACSSTTEMDIEFLRKNNIEYSQHIFKKCTEYSIPLIYASSAATYGAGENGYSDAHDKISDLKPLNPYGDSKQIFDEWALEQIETPPEWFGLKFFNVYGPNEYHKGHMMSVVKKAFEQIKEKGSVGLFKSYQEGFADGGQLRDFIYVKDVAQVMIELSKIQDSSLSGIYNLGTGKARSFEDLAKAVFKALGKTPSIEYIEMPESLRDQYQYYTQAEMGKLCNTLFDIKFSSLEEGVDNYVNEHLVKEDRFY